MLSVRGQRDSAARAGPRRSRCGAEGGAEQSLGGTLAHRRDAGSRWRSSQGGSFPAGPGCGRCGAGTRKLDPLWVGRRRPTVDI
ncbi:hypothetical protein [Ornithinimicrobium kibberense]|uniref:hypothetical protein n=1 Tax=Ornithinimicrobium kibberense TaxID=282060 RepID=UPI00360ECA1D